MSGIHVQQVIRCGGAGTRCEETILLTENQSTDNPEDSIRRIAGQGRRSSADYRRPQSFTETERIALCTQDSALRTQHSILSTQD